MGVRCLRGESWRWRSEGGKPLAISIMVFATMLRMQFSLQREKTNYGSANRRGQGGDRKAPLSRPQARFPLQREKSRNMEVQCEGASGATAKPPTRLRRGETSCNKKDQHRENKSFPILVGRAHLARQYVSGRMCSLRALLRERKVTGRDASLPAPWLSAFSILVARGTVGALPQTPQGTLSLDPARGNPPLTPPRD